jgi:hypothetical protein
MPGVFVSNADLAAAVSREVKTGTLRRIGSRLYTRNLKAARVNRFETLPDGIY